MHPIGVLPDIYGLWHQQYTAGAGNIRHVAVKGLKGYLIHHLISFVLHLSGFPRLLKSPGFFLENSAMGIWKVLENYLGPEKSWKLKLKLRESPGKISLKFTHFFIGSNGNYFSACFACRFLVVPCFYICGASVFIFKHLWVTKRSWKIFHGSPGKGLDFLSLKECILLISASILYFVLYYFVISK